MPLQIKPLTASAVEALNPNQQGNRRVMVGGERCEGLHIRLEGKSKVWALRIKVGEKRRDIGLGRYLSKFGKRSAEAWLDQLPPSAVSNEMAKLDGLSLAEARVVARKLRLHYRAAGILMSPTEAKGELLEGPAISNCEPQASTHSFKECASNYISAQQVGWKNSKHRQQWISTLTTYAFPYIGNTDVRAIDTKMVQDVLLQSVGSGKIFWEAKTGTASRLRGRIESVLDWAKVNGFREGDNPARWRGH
ncbi:phage integrase central domain-containing protein [Sphingobium yanoikuyae]|uniref:phage integrase central domain-containing protein n=1 Tax=Sphingobium yanoikuyae TaxID=13690 RepID=UPI00242B1999|nr:hypothetical protein [Sphingobium yanoikuyae]